MFNYAKIGEKGDSTAQVNSNVGLVLSEELLLWFHNCRIGPYQVIKSADACYTTPIATDLNESQKKSEHKQSDASMEVCMCACVRVCVWTPGWMY